MEGWSVKGERRAHGDRHREDPSLRRDAERHPGLRPVRAQRSILGSFIEKIEVSDDELGVEFRIPRPETPGRDDGGVLGTVTSGTPHWTILEP